MARPESAHPSGSPAAGTGLSRLDDGQLIERCLAGSEAAWRELVDRYERLVYAVPVRWGLDEEAAREVFQEVFTILVEQLPRLRHHAVLPKWLTTTARNVCRKWFRKARRASGLDAAEAGAAEPPPEFLARLEAQATLRLALGRLGGRCEELLVALYGGRGPAAYAEIAARLAMPVGSIGPTRARCLEKLLALLETLEEDGS